MNGKSELTRTVLYSVSGGLLTAVFGVLGATQAQAEPRDTAGSPAPPADGQSSANAAERRHSVPKKAEPAKSAPKSGGEKKDSGNSKNDKNGNSRDSQDRKGEDSRSDKKKSSDVAGSSNAADRRQQNADKKEGSKSANAAERRVVEPRRVSSKDKDDKGSESDKKSGRSKDDRPRGTAGSSNAADRRQRNEDKKNTAGSSNAADRRQQNAEKAKINGSSANGVERRIVPPRRVASSKDKGGSNHSSANAAERQQENLDRNRANGHSANASERRIVEPRKVAPPEKSKAEQAEEAVEETVGGLVDEGRRWADDEIEAERKAENKVPPDLATAQRRVVAGAYRSVHDGMSAAGELLDKLDRSASGDQAAQRELEAAAANTVDSVTRNATELWNDPEKSVNRAAEAGRQAWNDFWEAPLSGTGALVPDLIGPGKVTKPLKAAGSGRHNGGAPSPDGTESPGTGRSSTAPDQPSITDQGRSDQPGGQSPDRATPGQTSQDRGGQVARPDSADRDPGGQVARSGEADRDRGGSAARSGNADRDGDARAVRSGGESRDRDGQAARSGDVDRDGGGRAARSGGGDRDRGGQAATSGAKNNREVRVLPTPANQLPSPHLARPATDSHVPPAPQCQTPNSFVPGTPVLLADGTYKPIEQVQLGDRVLATDPTTGLTQSRPVVALIPGSGLKELVRITVDTDGDRGNATGTVTATDEHPFWTTGDRRWTDAEDLDRGTTLRTPDGRELRIVDVHEWIQQQAVHNLTVEGLHTYYVNVGGQNVLTHNDVCSALPSTLDSEFAVIGRRDDTGVAKSWEDHEVLELDQWSLDQNDEWIRGVIAKKQPVYLSSPINDLNLKDSKSGYPETVYAREINQLLKAGYTFSTLGRGAELYLIPPR